VTRILAALLGLLLTLLLATGWYAYAQHKSVQEKADQVALMQSDLNQQARINTATTQALEARIKSATRIVTVTKEIEREVPVLVPAGTPDLPPGWRVLHDAAAQGVQLPDPAQRADAAPVAASAAATTVNANYGACRGQDDAYQKLQQWLRGVKEKQ
jgi:hypothetical protein